MCNIYGIDRLVCVFVGQLAGTGINVKYIYDLPSRVDPNMAESSTRTCWLTFFKFF